jgi:FkbH-like protein
VLDLDPVVAALPAPLGDDRLRRFAGMAWSAGVELAYATEAATFCRAVAGRPRKVLVLDLDNTLWGGVAADDGIDGIQLGGLYPGNAYLDLQRTARTLRRQGVLLAIASKNEPDVATRVLAEHPAMVLRAEDFVATAIDWRPKDENIRRLARELGLGLDGIVFADDSRFECELVRHGVPEVAVVPLTGDPATFTTTLLRDDHFAVLDVTATDIVRTDLYRARARRHRFAETAETNRDYLAGLGLTVTLRAADEYAVGRLTQLAARTNQFVLVKNAHTDAATRGFLGADDRLLLEFEVDDVFGAEGVVGGFWISTGPDRWLIENLVMSCRVFSRGVERAALHGVAARAAAAGATHLDARLVRTPRNGPAAEFLATAGFVRAGDELRTLPLVPAPDLLPEWIRLDDEGNDRV